MNEQSRKDSKWKEIKNEIQKTWGLLTHDEIEKAKGSLHSLAGTIQKKYGMARHEVEEGLSRFLEKLAKNNKSGRPGPEPRKENEKPVEHNP